MIIIKCEDCGKIEMELMRGKNLKWYLECNNCGMIFGALINVFKGLTKGRFSRADICIRKYEDLNNKKEKI